MSVSTVTDYQITAGQYLRKRREAAGLSIDEVAAGFAQPSRRDLFAARLAEVEADRDALAEPTVSMLRGVFHFDPEIYRNLVAGLPAGTTVCRNCACSWKDACRGRPQNCYWAEPDLCSRCASGLPATTAPSFSIDATDPHAIALVAIAAALRLGNWSDAHRTLTEAIRDANTFARLAGASALNIRGGEDAMAKALDMTEWRRAHLPLGEGEPIHV